MKTARLLLLILLLPLLADAQTGLSAAKAFVSAPTDCFPLIPKMKRLDMLDYFNSGMDRPSENLLGGKSRVLTLTPLKIVIEETEGGGVLSSVSLGKVNNDTVYIVTTDVNLPARDGSLRVYDRDWKQLVTGRWFAEPTLETWLVKKDRKTLPDIENAVPFVPAAYDFDPETGILTLTSTVADMIPAEDYALVKDLLRPTLQYKLTNKGFTLRK